MLALPPSGRRVPPPPRSLLLGLRSYGLMRQSRVALLYFGHLASFVESSQVATSPCCYRDYPDVISANLSPDAWSPTPTVPPSAFACFFLGVIGLPKTLFRSASRWYPRTRFFRGLFLEVADISLCSGLRVCSPPRSLLPLRIFRRAAEAFTSGLIVLRCLCTHRICYPSEYRQLTEKGLPPF